MRIFLTILAILLCLSAGATVFLISSQTVRLESKTLRILYKAGITNADTIRTKASDGILLISNIEFDEQGFTRIERIKIPYSWYHALGLRPYRLIIEGGEIAGNLESDGKFDLSGWNNEKLLTALKSLKPDNIEIKNIQLELVTPSWGGIVVTMDGTLKLPALTENGHIALNLSSTQHQLMFKGTAQGPIFNADQWQISIDILEGKLDRPFLKASRITGNAALIKAPGQDYAAELNINAGAMRIGDYPWQNVEFSLLKDASDALPVLNGKALALGQPQIMAGLSLKLGGDHKTINGHIEAPDFNALNTFLSRGKFDVFDQIPLWVKKYKNLFIDFDQTGENRFQYNINIPEQELDISGNIDFSDADNIEANYVLTPSVINHEPTPLKARVEAKGNFTISKTEEKTSVSATTSIEIDEGRWKQSGITFENINGKLSYQNFTNPFIDNAKLNFTLPFQNAIKQSGIVTFSHHWGKEPEIKNILLNVFGGTLNTIQTTKEVYDINITGINLETLSAAMNLSSLSMTGKAKGSVSLRELNKKLVITTGSIQSAEKGIFKYKPASYPAFLNGQSLELTAIRKALENYHYERFEMNVEGDLKGKWRIIVDADGSNPDIFNGRPVSINLTFTIDPEQLFKNLIKS